VAKALAQGLGTKVKNSLEQAIKLSPKHADAHIALAAFHAEVIDKVGSLIGGMTYGAKKDIGLALYKDALKLHPASAIGMIEYANGMVMLEGDKKMKEATKLYEQAASQQAAGCDGAAGCGDGQGRAGRLSFAEPCGAPSGPVYCEVRGPIVFGARVLSNFGP
jgi:hypothetical protein